MTAPLLYPSIDLRDGKVVRLRQGDYDAQIDYPVDAVDTAAGFCAAGARWIHVVDLDAALTGERRNGSTIAAIAAAVTGQASLQVGGGVRSVDDVAALADVGVSRAVMGSAAVDDPSLVDVAAPRLPIAVGLDHRAGVVAVHGWTSSSDLTVDAAFGRYPAAAAFVITDISRDGMLAGPDVDGMRAAVAATSTPIIASGGVGSLDDLATLATVEGLAGVITGRALFDGRFDVAAAIGALAGATS